MFQAKFVDKTEIHILSPITYLENWAVYLKTWQNCVEPDRSQMTIWRMRIACWTTKAKNAHSECVIPIAFPLKKNGCMN
jgi:hypothetical protein